MRETNFPFDKTDEFESRQDAAKQKMSETKILLTGGFKALVDAEDAPLVTAIGRWHVTKRKGRSQQYATHCDSKGRVYMHSVIINPPKGMLVDHINGDGLDNRRSNLRLCTASQNCSNSKHRSNNTSGYRGVCWFPQLSKWKAQIAKDGRRISLGYFETKEQAAKAYDKAANLLHGEFAVLNFPLEVLRG